MHNSHVLVAPQRLLLHAVTGNVAGARIWKGRARVHLDGGALPRSVGAQKTIALALLNAERQIVYGGKRLARILSAREDFPDGPQPFRRFRFEK